MPNKTIIVTLIILYIFIHTLFIEPGKLNITKYEIEDDALSGVRVVFLSDLHLKKGEYKRLNKIVKLTSAQKPDIVLLGGDFAKSPKKAQNLSIDFIAAKLNLIGDVPKIAVLGDDDWLADGEGTKNALIKNRIKVLENSSIRIVSKNRYINIIGVKDVFTRDANVTKAMRRTRNPRIVITHNPDIYYDVLDDVSLILAGHTHGGQFVLPMTPPLFVPSRYGALFASGLVKPRNNSIIISRGLGTDKLRVRFNCAPEIVVVDFVKVGTAKKRK